MEILLNLYYSIDQLIGHENKYLDIYAQIFSLVVRLDMYVYEPKHLDMYEQGQP